MKSEPFFPLSWPSQPAEFRRSLETHVISMNRIDINELRILAEEYVASEPARGSMEGFWQTPLLAGVPLGDRFDMLPQIAFDAHMHPHDLLPTARSLIVFLSRLSASW